MEGTAGAPLPPAKEMSGTGSWAAGPREATPFETGALPQNSACSVRIDRSGMRAISGYALPSCTHQTFACQQNFLSPRTGVLAQPCSTPKADPCIQWSQLGCRRRQREMAQFEQNGIKQEHFRGFFVVHCEGLSDFV